MEKVLGLAAVDYSEAKRAPNKKPKTRQNASLVGEAVARWNISTKLPITTSAFPHRPAAGISTTVPTVAEQEKLCDDAEKSDTFSDFGNYDRSKTRAAKVTSRLTTAQLQQDQNVGRKRSKSQQERSSQKVAIQAQHDQVKALMGLLAKNNLTVEHLMAMSEEKQKKTLLDIARSSYGDGLDDVRLSMDLSAALRGIVSFNRSLTPVYQRVVKTRGTVSNGRLYARHLPTDMLPKTSTQFPQTNSGDDADEKQVAEAKGLNDVVLLGSCGSPEHKGEGGSFASNGLRTKQFPDARQRMLEVIRRTPLGNVKNPLTLTVKDTTWEERAKLLKESTAMTAATNGVFKSSGNDNDSADEEEAAAMESTGFSKPGDRIDVVVDEQYDSSGKKMSDFKKYFKLVEMGVPAASVADKMVGEEAVRTTQKALALLQLDPTKPIPKDFFHPAFDHINNRLQPHVPPPPLPFPPPPKGVGAMIAISEHADYGPYFKMLEMGIPRDGIKEKMRFAGLDSSLLDKDPSHQIPITSPIRGGYGYGFGPGMGPGLGPGMGPGFGPGMGPGLGPGMGAGFGPGMGPGLGPGMGAGFGPGMGPGLGAGMGAGFGPGMGPGGGRGGGRGFGYGPGMGRGGWGGAGWGHGPGGGGYYGAPGGRFSPAHGGMSFDNDSWEYYDSPEGRSLKREVPIAEHPLYEKFFSMLKAGLSMEEVQQKMISVGLDPDMLLKNPNDLIPLVDPMTLKKDEEDEDKADEEAQVQDPEEEMVKRSEHPKFAKFFKMLKVGMPLPAVKMKMEQEGLDPEILGKDPDELIPLNEKKEEMVKRSEHPKYAKFFKMLKVGMPLPAVKMKVELEGLDPSMLDKDPDELIPLNEKEEEMVKVSEHPSYSKFFKMLKVGMPLPAVKMKVELEGLDPSMLDKDPEEMIPLNDKAAAPQMVKAIDHPQYGKYFAMKRDGDIPLEDIQQQVQEAGLDPQVLKLSPMELIPLDTKISPTKTRSGSFLSPPSGSSEMLPRKKRVHMKGLDASRVKDTLWADANDEFALQLDEDEFRKLFVKEATDDDVARAKAAAKKQKEKMKKKVVVLIDHKRAQNAGIALARIKFSCTELREKISNMHGDGITTDQLRSLEEFLPTPEEEEKVKAYKGDPELLGLAEQYMLQMVGFRSEAVERIQCMIYKQLFKLRVNECKSKLHKIENACDDVKMSGRLRKVLKAILKVVNQMNDGEEHRGFTLDSLLKLQSTKAFDQKTSVLQYIINLIHRKDKDPLLFPEDLKHVAEASRINLDALSNDIDLLRSEFDNSFQVVIDIEESTPSPHSGAMLDFFARAETQCKELAKNFEDAKKKMTGVLAYFGEETHLSSIDFFSTLNRFVQEFKHTREVVERIHNAELKAKREEEARAAAAARKEAEAKNPKRQSSSGAKAQDLSPISSPEKLLEELSPAEQRQLRRQRRRSTADLRKLSIDIRSPSQEERRHIAAESPLPGDTSDSATRGSPDREDLSSDGSPIRSSLRLRPQSTRAVSKVNSFNREESEDVSNSDVEGNGNAANLKSKMPGLPRKKREGIAIDRSTSAESVGDDLFSQPSTPLKPSQIKNRNRSMIEMRIPSLGKTKSSYNFDLLGGDDIQPTAPPVADTVVDVSVPVATDAAAVRSRVQERRERRERRRSSAAAAKDQSTPTVHDATAAAPSVTTTAKGTGEDDSLNQSIMAQATEDNIQPLHAGDAHSPLSLTPLVSPERRQGEEEDQPNLDLSEAEMSAALSTSTTTALDESVDTNAVPGIDPDERETVEDGGATGSTDEGRHIEEVDAVSADITSTTSKIVENSVTPEIKEASLPSSPPPPPPHADLARPLSILKSPGTKSPGRKKSARFAQNPVAGCSNDPSHSIDDASTAVHTDEVDIQQAKEVADVPLIANEELVEEAVAAAEPSTATATITTAVDADERVTTAVTETVSTFSPEELAATIPATDIEKAAARVLSNSNTQSAASSASRSHSSSNENVLSTTEE